MLDEQATATFHRMMPLAREFDMQVLAHEAAEVRLRIAWNERLCTAGGILHGGTLMALADTAGAACAMLNLPDGAQQTATVESKTNFFRPLGKGNATATATPLHAGRRFVVVETAIVDDEGRIVTKTTQTQAVL